MVGRFRHGERRAWSMEQLERMTGDILGQALLPLANGGASRLLVQGGAVPCPVTGWAAGLLGAKRRKRTAGGQGYGGSCSALHPVRS